ncbi:DMT family transporter [uncultured Oscillibacter sp.]|uniref:DMT family transporter n=1 Tax=uncultured Oscillibacter sp. TaxID=876091 RepID=UPI002804BCE9|nr:DMT family transporter [uncultured Oscillibacter sp.]
MKDQKTKAICLMLVSALSFSVMQIFVKLTSGEVHTFEQVFFRNLISFFAAAAMARRKHTPVLAELRKGGAAVWGRSFFGFLGIVLFFYAIGNARQADVAMLNRSAPVFVTLFAALFLKEKLNFVKIGATLVCLAGAYVAMQPSFDSNAAPLLCALCAAVVSGLAYTLLAVCKKTVSSETIVLHFSALSTVLAGAMMVPYFRLPSLGNLLLLLMVGIFAAIGQFLLTFAYQVVPASEISIYQYSGVVFTALLGYWILGETLDRTSLLGAVLILAGIFWVFEYRRHFDG